MMKRLNVELGFSQLGKTYLLSGEMGTANRPAKEYGNSYPEGYNASVNRMSEKDKVEIKYY